ncbi:MAG TPA: hypothetical protein VMS93_10275, partial [Candidatus Saccharimonadales bacterium]|nr:hypothetical protein [Candidatus Saccharimonadales bacterium]
MRSVGRLLTSLGVGLGLVTSAVGLTPGTSSAAADDTTHINVNNISCVVSNLGSYGYDRSSQQVGLEWPRGSGHSLLFAAGLWVGARINSQTQPTVKAAEYARQWGPGPIIGDTSAADGPTFRVYKIRRGDTPQSNLDYANWPAALGAPVDESGNPRLLGDQTLWCLFNDRSRLAQRSQVGTHGIVPDSSLGLEVQQTVYGFSATGSLNNVVYLKWRLINKGHNQLHDAYVSCWADPD